MPKADREYKIYRITFAHDGAQYVGRTVQKLKYRIAAHTRGEKSGNSELRRRMKSGDPFTVETLATADTLARARCIEIVHIRALEKPINCAGATVMPVWIYGTPPYRMSYPLRRHYKVAEARCSICRTIKPAKEFYMDRSRHNGLGSRCKECHYFIGQYANKRISENKAERSKRYHRLKAELKERYADA